MSYCPHCRRIVKHRKPCKKYDATRQEEYDLKKEAMKKAADEKTRRTEKALSNMAEFQKQFPEVMEYFQDRFNQHEAEMERLREYYSRNCNRRSSLGSMDLDFWWGLFFFW